MADNGNGYPIVGAKFRPPALALLETLGIGTPLVARREPQNEFDPNAIQVLVDTNDFEPSDVLAQRLEAFGKSIEEVFAQASWHLGYIPRNDALSLAPRMDSAGVATLHGTLQCNAQGQPRIKLEGVLP